MWQEVDQEDPLSLTPHSAEGKRDVCDPLGNDGLSATAADILKQADDLLSFTSDFLGDDDTIAPLPQPSEPSASSSFPSLTTTLPSEDARKSLFGDDPISISASDSPEIPLSTPSSRVPVRVGFLGMKKKDEDEDEDAVVSALYSSHTPQVTFPFLFNIK
jgi:hypothetical protein